jgi:hypothetical protein
MKIEEDSMADVQSTDRAGKSEKSTDFRAFPVDLADTGKKQFESMIGVQKQFVETASEMNRAWIARAQSEANLVSDFIGKLASARSLPDVASAYQECMGRQLQIFAEDGRRLFDDSEKIMRASTRLFSNGSGNFSS